MKFNELFQQWFQDRPVCLLSVATTGVGNSDDIVGVWYKIGDQPTEFLVVAGVDPTASEPFSHIGKEFVERNGIPREEVAETLINLFKTTHVWTYNVPFMRKFLLRLQSPKLESVLDMHDIQALINFVDICESFPSEKECGWMNYSFIVSTWARPVFPAIRKSILRLVPEWIESADFPVPSSMVSGLYEVFRVLGQAEVRFLLSTSATPASPSAGIPTIPTFGLPATQKS